MFLSRSHYLRPYPISDLVYSNWLALAYSYIFIGPIPWRPLTMTAINHDGHKPWRPQGIPWQLQQWKREKLTAFRKSPKSRHHWTNFIKLCLWLSWFVVVMVVAVMVIVCGRHGCGRHGHCFWPSWSVAIIVEPLFIHQVTHIHY